MPSEWDQFQPAAPAPWQSILGNRNPNSGVQEINSNLKGEEYLKQYTPEEQSMVRDFLAGRRMPTGNPRKQDFIREAAAKYGQDIGLPADDTSFKARQTMHTELSRGSPVSLGGQLRNGTTAMDHLAKVAEAAANMKNYDPVGIAPIAHGINAIRNLTSVNSGAARSLQDAAHNYGSEITKFYAGSPGGTAERQRFLNSLNPNLSPVELADVLAQELNLIPGKMDQIKQEIASTLGPYAEKQHMHKFDEQDKHMQRTLRAIDKLRGQEGSITAGTGATAGSAPAAASTAPAAAPSAPAFQSGATAVNPKTGERIRFDGSQWVPIK